MLRAYQARLSPLQMSHLDGSLRVLPKKLDPSIRVVFALETDAWVSRHRKTRSREAALNED